jgi:hypothetical protein
MKKEDKLEKKVSRFTKKTKKKIKRGWKKIFFITIILLLILGTLAFIGGLRLRFALHDALVIGLDASGNSFRIMNNEAQDVEFIIAMSNSMFCSANCSYSFYDRSVDKVLDSGKIKMNDGDLFVRNYVLEPYSKGEGQKVYNFEVQCVDINTFLCTTMGALRKKSSFVTLNYELSESEKEIKDKLKSQLVDNLEIINNASAYVQRSYYLINNSLIKESSEEYFELSDDVSNVIIETDIIFEMWSDEEYIQLDEAYSSYLPERSNNLLLKSKTFFEDVYNSIIKQNELIGELNTLQNSFFEENLFLKLEKVENFYNKIIVIKFDLEKGKYENVLEFEDDLNELSSEFMGLVNVSEQNEVKGYNIVLNESAKKCFLGHCDDVSNDSCFELEKYISEFQDSAYISDINISGLDDYENSSEGVKIIISNETLNFYENYCGVNVSVDVLDNISNIEIVENITIYPAIQNELTENLPKCCVYGECDVCCVSEECKNDPSLYPIVLMHGHSLLRATSPEPLLDIFNRIQYNLQDDGFINAGTVQFDFNLSNYEAGDWGISGSPISAKASYYYDYFYSLGHYIHITKNVDNIDTYAIRLNDIVKLIKYRTGKEKVNLIAHSMGGLVARRYLQIFGEGSVDKIILIGTPNHGIEGNIKNFCKLFGEKRECEDMYSGSVLITKLNDPSYSIKDVEVYTISGKGCDTDGYDGDGVVKFENSILDYAKSYVINGTCYDTYGTALHNDLLDPYMYPELYEYIKEILDE